MAEGGPGAWRDGASVAAAVAAAIGDDRLVRPGDHVLVAVSGGPDSVALLHALVEVRDRHRLVLEVCHVHHGLRPEADRDAEFVTRLAARLGCAARVERVTVLHGEGFSPEDAAREARLRVLARTARVSGARRIALGHTADDQAETVLMRLLQGAGPRGLAGIPARRGRLIRPLLAVDRAAVLAYLAEHGLDFVEDATNRDPTFLRNRIRHELLPLLQAQAGPHVAPALRRTAGAARELVEALDALVLARLQDRLAPSLAGMTLDLDALRGLRPGAVKVALRHMVRAAAPPGPLRSGLRRGHLQGLVDLLDAPVGARVRLPGAVVVERGRDRLWALVPSVAAPPAPVAVPGTTRWRGVALTVEVTARASGRPADPAGEAWFDADGLAGDLVVRAHAPGDRIVPFGGARAVRASRLLAAAGVPRLARARWPVLVRRTPHGDEVLWMIGVRRGATAPVAATTRTVVRIRSAFGAC